jgi:hypothetical protein
MTTTERKLWPKVSKENPCPICSHSDWLCRFGDKAVLCMRIESPHPARYGGFYHFYDSEKPKPAYIPPKRRAHKFGDFGYADKMPDNGAAKKLSKEIGVSEESISSLGVFLTCVGFPFSIPMRDGDNKIIGIHLRGDDGSKKAVVGSRNGLFIPSSVGELIERNKLLKT